MKTHHQINLQKVGIFLGGSLGLLMVAACHNDLQSYPKLQDTPTSLEKPALSLEAIRSELSSMQFNVQENSLPHGV